MPSNMTLKSTPMEPEKFYRKSRRNVQMCLGASAPCLFRGFLRAPSERGKDCAFFYFCCHVFMRRANITIQDFSRVRIEHG